MVVVGVIRKQLLHRLIYSFGVWIIRIIFQAAFYMLFQFKEFRIIIPSHFFERKVHSYRLRLIKYGIQRILNTLPDKCSIRMIFETLLHRIIGTHLLYIRLVRKIPLAIFFSSCHCDFQLIRLKRDLISIKLLDYFNASPSFLRRISLSTSAMKSTNEIFNTGQI